MSESWRGIKYGVPGIPKRIILYQEKDEQSETTGDPKERV
jgi:hypothetical protein